MLVLFNCLNEDSAVRHTTRYVIFARYTANTHIYSPVISLCYDFMSYFKNRHMYVVNKVIICIRVKVLYNNKISKVATASDSAFDIIRLP